MSLMSKLLYSINVPYMSFPPLNAFNSGLYGSNHSALFFTLILSQIDSTVENVYNYHEIKHFASFGGFVLEKIYDVTFMSSNKDIGNMETVNA